MTIIVSDFKLIVPKTVSKLHTNTIFTLKSQKKNSGGAISLTQTPPPVQRGSPLLTSHFLEWPLYLLILATPVTGELTALPKLADEEGAHSCFQAASFRALHLSRTLKWATSRFGSFSLSVFAER